MRETLSLEDYTHRLALANQTRVFDSASYRNYHAVDVGVVYANRKPKSSVRTVPKFAPPIPTRMMPTQPKFNPNQPTQLRSTQAVPHQITSTQTISTPSLKQAPLTTKTSTVPHIPIKAITLLHQSPQPNSKILISYNPNEYISKVLLQLLINILSNKFKPSSIVTVNCLNKSTHLNHDINYSTVIKLSNSYELSDIFDRTIRTSNRILFVTNNDLLPLDDNRILDVYNIKKTITNIKAANHVIFTDHLIKKNVMAEYGHLFADKSVLTFCCFDKINAAKELDVMSDGVSNANATTALKSKDVVIVGWIGNKMNITENFKKIKAVADANKSCKFIYHNVDESTSIDQVHEFIKSNSIDVMLNLNSKNEDKYNIIHEAFINGALWISNDCGNASKLIKATKSSMRCGFIVHSDQEMGVVLGNIVNKGLVLHRNRILLELDKASNKYAASLLSSIK